MGKKSRSSKFNNTFYGSKVFLSKHFIPYTTCKHDFLKNVLESYKTYF